MACGFGLFTLMGGSPVTTGTWTFTSTTNGVGTANVNVGIPPVLTLLNPGNAVGMGNNPVVDFGPASNGDYVFTYTTGTSGTCQDEATLTITVEDGVTAGVDANISLCSNDNTVYSIVNFLNGGDGLIAGLDPVTPVGVGLTGTLTGTGIGVVSTPPGAGHVANTTNPLDDTFNPFNVAVGPYTFIYNISRNGAQNCENCQDSATVTLTVATAPSAGIDSAATVCRNLA